MIVFLSNQGRKSQHGSWKEKITHLARAVSYFYSISNLLDEKKLGDEGVPFLIFGAMAKDEYRKPMPGMWVALERIAKDASVVIGQSSLLRT